MKPFIHCPACAHRLERPADDGGARCPNCGRTWYRNPSPTAAGVVVKDGKALIAVRGREPHKGKVDAPGGFIENGEDLLAGLTRELREELGIEVEVSPADFLQSAPHQYGDEGDWLLSMGFRARWVSGELAPADDVAEVRWVSKEELDGLDFAWPHDRELVRKALEDV